MLQKPTSSFGIERLSPNVSSSRDKRRQSLRLEGLQTPLKKNYDKLKPLLLMRCDENTKEVKFCIDMQKYKYLFRTGPSAILMYIHHQSENNNLYFQNIQNDKYLPLINTNLKKGIYLWNHVIYNEHKNLFIYQMQCVLSESIEKVEYKRQKINVLEKSIAFIESDVLLLKIACILGNHIIVICNEDQDNILGDIQFNFLQNQDQYFKLQVINLIRNKRLNLDEWENVFGQFIKIDAFEESLFYYNLNQSQNEQWQVLLQNWQTNLMMSTEKKTYKNIEIDFLTLISIVQSLSRLQGFEYSQQNLQENIYSQGILRQLEYTKKDTLAQYRDQLSIYCSQSDERNEIEISNFLNQQRMKALSQFYTQMRAFTQLPEFNKQCTELQTTIHKMEYQCIKFYIDIFNNELKHKIAMSEKKINLNEFKESFLSLLKDFEDLNNYRDIKYNHVKESVVDKYGQLLRKYLQKKDTIIQQECKLKNQTMNEQQMEIDTKYEQQLQSKIKTLQQYNEILKEEIKSLKKLIEINLDINKDVELIKQISDLDIEIIKLKVSLQKIYQMKQ